MAKMRYSKGLVFNWLNRSKKTGILEHSEGMIEIRKL